MRKILLSLLVALFAVGSAWAETIVIDGSKLTSTATTADSEAEFGGVKVVYSKGAKQQTSTSAKRFADKAILIGKKGAYVYNKTALPGKITKFEIYANAGASAKVSVGVNFSSSAITAFDAESANTYAATLSKVDSVYDCSAQLPADATYFWYQVTNEFNSQVQFRITYEADNVTAAPSLSTNKTYITESGIMTITNNQEGATVYYTLDGTDPTTESESFTGASKEVNLYANITTVKAMAVSEGRANSRIVSETYTYAVYPDLAHLVAADLESGSLVWVVLDKVAIKSFQVSNDKRIGVFFDVQKGGKDVEVFYKTTAAPDSWSVGGFLSYDLVATWTEFNGTWELVPYDSDFDWTKMKYEAPAKEAPTLKFTVDPIEIEDVKTVDIEYNGDGTLSVVSDNESVATAAIKDGKLEITAVKIGTAKITVSATETDKCQAVSYYRTVSVVTKLVPAAIPFAFDGGKAAATRDLGMISSGLGSDYGKSPKLKFDSDGDYLTVAIAESAGFVHYSIKGNPPQDHEWEGTFEVTESADGETFTTLKSYTALGDSIYETYALAAETRYVRFQYVKKAYGNVALGTIKIDNEPAAGISVLTTKSPRSDARKSIQNGRIVIIQNGKKYDLTGREIQ